MTNACAFHCEKEKVYTLTAKQVTKQTDCIVAPMKRLHIVWDVDVRGCDTDIFATKGNSKMRDESGKMHVFRMKTIVGS